MLRITGRLESAAKQQRRHVGNALKPLFGVYSICDLGYIFNIIDIYIQCQITECKK